MRPEVWATMSPLEEARRKRGSRKAVPLPPPVEVRPAPVAVEAKAAAAEAIETARSVPVKEAAAEAHAEVKRSPELRRVYEYDPAQGCYVDVLRVFPPKAKPKRGSVSAAEKAREEVRIKNRDLRKEIGDHRYAGQRTANTGAKDLRCKVHDDGHGAGQNHMRSGRAFAR